MRGLVLIRLQSEQDRGLEQLCDARVDFKPQAFRVHSRALDHHKGLAGVVVLVCCGVFGVRRGLFAPGKYAAYADPQHFATNIIYMYKHYWKHTECVAHIPVMIWSMRSPSLPLAM